MKIAIRSIKGRGDIQVERIVLEALENIQIGSYIVADTTYMDGDKVSNRLRHTFWIPDKLVDKGDLVVIYTKTGRDTTKANDSGNKTHFFYWGLERTIWNKDEDTAVVFAIDDWAAKRI